MQGKWRWLLYAIAVWQIAKIAFLAFSVPWRWTFYQCLFVFFMLIVFIGLGLWASVWRRGGIAAVKERWAAIQRPSPLSKGFYIWSYAFWIVVAVALVFYYNMTAH